MDLTLHVWRQNGPSAEGRMAEYKLNNISADASFLEMLDQLNEQLIAKNEEPVAFDHDCREGICGMCGLMINGMAHGPGQTTTCQLHMRSFQHGDHITIEPWRAKPFPVIKDLVVNRSAFDRIVESGGYISTGAGAAPEANSILIPKKDADASFEAAVCIGCGACVAACPNAAAMLFTGAKISHLAHLPQGQVERKQRAQSMVKAMDVEGFGNCTFHAECEAACPKNISIRNISLMNHELLRANLSPQGV